MDNRRCCYIGLSIAFVTCALTPAFGGTVNLNNRSAGPYTTTMMRLDWNIPPWNNGVSQGRASIVTDADAFEGSSLKIDYPAGGVGPLASGAQWRWELGNTYDELILEYKVMFPVGFEFVKGGKLPGLVGGTANTGGSVPNGFDGWSARMMWVGGGDVIQYVYHPDQPHTFGDTMTWNVGGQRTFTPGVWHTVRNRVVMNTPTQNDGIIQGWFDGELALDRQDVRFRDTTAFGIDTMYFSSFYGGADPSWAPSADQSIFFDDFHVTTSLADFDTDFDVDGTDLLAFQEGFGIASGAELADGDADRDGDVDGADFLAWQRALSSTASTVTQVAIPEPSTNVMLLIIALVAALVGCRRQRGRLAIVQSRATWGRAHLIGLALFPALFAALMGANQLWAGQIGDGNVLTWKDGRTAAATLTIDDNFQFDHAWWTATANTYDVRFTWFVISGNVGTGNLSVNGTWADFVALDAADHDIQSHTVDHFPNFPAAGPMTLETNYTQAITAIETNVPGTKVTTLAYPFGLQAPNDKSLAGQHYIGARGVTGVLNTLNGVDYLNVNSLSTDAYAAGFQYPGSDVSRPWADVSQLITQGNQLHKGWLSVHSHAMSNDEKTAITGLLDYLTSQPDEFWIAPFTDVSQYAQERDAATLVTNVIGPEEIQFTLTDTLNNALFDQSLTVEVQVDGSWIEVVASQAGQQIPVDVIERGGDRFALVNAVPDLGVVSLTQFTLAGDYDNNGTVGPNDYLVWKANFGSISQLAADGNKDGTVNAADYSVWLDNLGATNVIGAGSSAIPEPLTAELLLLGILVLRFYVR